MGSWFPPGLMDFFRQIFHYLTSLVVNLTTRAIKPPQPEKLLSWKDHNTAPLKKYPLEDTICNDKSITTPLHHLYDNDCFKYSNPILDMGDTYSCHEAEELFGIEDYYQTEIAPYLSREEKVKLVDSIYGYIQKHDPFGRANPIAEFLSQSRREHK